MPWAVPAEVELKEGEALPPIDPSVFFFLGRVILEPQVVLGPLESLDPQ